MKIEKKNLNEALKVLGKVVSQTSPGEVQKSIRFVSDANGGGNVTWQRTLLLKIFYAQMIKKFAEAIHYLIDSYRTAKKVS